MRLVKRIGKPLSLSQYAEQWTLELLAEIKEKGDYSKVDSKYKDKYRQEDVKKALEEMYTDHCCYCECLIGISTYGRIEHLKPKSLPQFYKYSFEWNNLHWCCEVCNTSYKGIKWNFEHPILDPALDDIKAYLRINLQTGEYEKINDNPRAKTTIEDVGLNREKLVKARRRTIVQVIKNYKVHKQCGKESAFLENLQKLKEDVSFPSVYDELIAYLSTDLGERCSTP